MRLFHFNLLVAFLFILNSYIDLINGLRINGVTDGRTIARLGHPIELTCEHDKIAQANERISWYVPSLPTVAVTEQQVSGKKFYVKWDPNSNGRRLTLTILEFEAADTGIYSCKYIAQIGSQQKVLDSASVEVTQYQEIINENCEIEQWIPEGKDSIIRCSVRGIPPPTVSWYLKDKQISTGDKFVYRDYGLSILNTNKGDAGLYTIKAVQEGKSEIFQQVIIVKVYSKPRITYGPEVIGPYYKAAVDHWDAVLQCLAEGDPMPTIHWYRSKNPNQELPLMNPQKFFSDTNPQVGKLKIMSALYPDDEDTYICRAMIASSAVQFMASETYAEAKLNLTVNVAPIFLQWDRMTATTMLGKSVTLECRVRATKPRMQFQKHGYAAFVDGRQPDDPRIFVQQVVDNYDTMQHILRLTIDNTRMEDSWNYTCIATNDAANYSRNATIEIHQILNMSTAAPNNVAGWVYNATNLTCIAEGLPHPQWTWYRGIIPVISTGNRTFHIITLDYERSSQSWLQVYAVHGMEEWVLSEDYFCNATNAYGTSQYKVHMHRAQNPGPPIVNQSDSTSSSVSFRIQPGLHDGGRPVERYEVMYRASQGRTAWYGPVIVPAENPQLITIDGLMQDSVYYFDFFARSVVGLSLPTSMRFQTPFASIPGIVKIVSSNYSIYPTTYFLRWQIPPTGGGPLYGYRVVYQKVRRDSTSGKIIEKIGDPVLLYPDFTNPNLRDYYLKDLDADSDYSVQIQGINRRGMSPFHEEPFVFRTAQMDSFGAPPRVRGIAGVLQKPFVLFPILLLILLNFIKRNFF